MTVVTLEEAKAHLRYFEDDRDAEILLKLEAAEDEARAILNRPLPWTDDDGVEVPVPSKVKAAILLLLEANFSGDEKTLSLLAERAMSLLAWDRVWSFG